MHIGPIQIHYRKLVSSYRFIGSSLKRIKKKVSGLKIFGSDQEDNLVNAFKEEFPEAINLQCFRHFKQNIERRLSKWETIDREDVCVFFLRARATTFYNHSHNILRHFLISLPNFSFTTTKTKREN